VRPEARWKAPFPVGYAAAIDSMGSVAAPLLASVSAALTTLVISNEKAFRWPTLAVFLLVGATLALITAVQSAFRAKQYVVTPSDLEQWWPISDAGGVELRRQYQRYHAERHQVWATAASRAYDTGLLCFLFGLAVITTPSDFGSWSLVVAGLAFLGALSEVAWIVYSHFRPEPVRLPEVGPEWTPPTCLDTEGDA
jgi:drug/metabolite transporter (DMT)-like permease